MVGTFGKAERVAVAHLKVEAMVRVAQILGLRVIAEGVETIEQCSILRKMGCEQEQGYFFSRPISPQAFAELTSLKAA